MNDLLKPLAISHTRCECQLGMRVAPSGMTQNSFLEGKLHGHCFAANATIAPKPEQMARLLGAVGLLGAKVLQRLRPELRIAAGRRVAQPNARLDQRRVVARRHVQLRIAHMRVRWLFELDTQFALNFGHA